MPSGHTDRDTINQRRPLSERMARFMHALARPDRDILYRDLDHTDKSVLRGLRDRGYIKDHQGRNDEPIFLSHEGEAWLETEEALRTYRARY